MPLTVKLACNEIYRASSDNISLSVFEAGEPVTALLASYALYDSLGNGKGTGSVSVAGHQAVIPVLASMFDQLEIDCRVELVITAGGLTEKLRKYFNVVDAKILNTVIDADLLAFYPALYDDLPPGDDGYSTQIALAFDLVKTDIYNRGPRLKLAVDDEQIRPLVARKALALLFDNASRTTEDIWWQRYLKHEGKYQAEFSQTPFRFDRDKDGTIDGERSYSVVRLQR